MGVAPFSPWFIGIKKALGRGGYGYPGYGYGYGYPGYGYPGYGYGGLVPVVGMIPRSETTRKYSPDHDWVYGYRKWYGDGHVHRYENATAYAAGHVHLMSGVTGPNIGYGLGHVHRLHGIASYAAGHRHRYSTTTKPALYAADGSHSHSYSGVTTANGRPLHRHTYEGVTSKAQALAPTYGGN